MWDMMVSASQLTGRFHLRSVQKGEFDTPRIHTNFGSRSFSTGLHLLQLHETSQDLSVYDCIFLLDYIGLRLIIISTLVF